MTKKKYEMTPSLPPSLTSHSPLSSHHPLQLRTHNCYESTPATMMMYGNVSVISFWAHSIRIKMNPYPFTEGLYQYPIDNHQRWFWLECEFKAAPNKIRDIYKTSFDYEWGDNSVHCLRARAIHLDHATYTSYQFRVCPQGILQNDYFSTGFMYRHPID